MPVAEGVTSYFPKENVGSSLLNERCVVARVCGQLAIIHKVNIVPSGLDGHGGTL